MSCSVSLPPFNFCFDESIIEKSYKSNNYHQGTPKGPLFDLYNIISKQYRYTARKLRHRAPQPKQARSRTKLSKTKHARSPDQDNRSQKKALKSPKISTLEGSSKDLSERANVAGHIPGGEDLDGLGDGEGEDGRDQRVVVQDGEVRAR